MPALSATRVLGVHSEAMRERMNADAKFRLIFERSSDAILLLDTSTNKFVEYNPATLEMLRCSPEELSALHPSDLSPPRQPDGRSSFEKANEMIATAVLSGSHRFEWIHCSPHRSDFHVEVLLTPIEPTPSPVLLVVWRDITERKRQEEAMRQAQKLESLGVLAGGIAHDFNNLLQVVLGHVVLARKLLPADHAAVPHLCDSELAAMSAANLSRQMLAYSGNAGLAVDAVDLSVAVRQIAELMRISIGKNVRQDYDLSDGLPAVKADKSQVQQVVMNLVINASEAIGGAEGSITLRTHAASLDEADIRGDFVGQELAPGRFVQLDVHDTGSGITPEVLSRMFDPFFSTKQIGRGLGLSALRGIVKSHGGGLRVHSRVGVGTTFSVLFPVADIPAAPPNALATTARPPGGDTVLLVDDEMPVRKTMRSILENMGYQVIEAIDGMDALERFDQMRARIAWVLMDLTMPRLDGYSAFTALRARAPNLKVILASGWTETHLIDRFSDNPPSAFLCKPFQSEELQKALERAGIAVAVTEAGDSCVAHR